MWIITFSLLLIIFGLWFRWRKKQFSVFKELGIPGPKPSIFLGNLKEMLQMTPIACHEKWIKKYGKVVGYYFGTTPTIIVADVALLKQILIKDFHKFPNRAQDKNHQPKKGETCSAKLTLLKNRRWKEIRSIITPSFTTSKMKLISQIMDGAVDSLIDVIEKRSKSGKSFDIYELYKRLTMDVIGRAAFGIQTNVQNNPNDIILKAAKTLLGSDFYSFLNILSISFPELSRVWNIFKNLNLYKKSKGRNPMIDLIEHMKDIVILRRRSKENNRQDLLQIMMDARILESKLNSIANEDLTAEDLEKKDQNEKYTAINENKGNILCMTDFEIIDNSVLFFLAGYETTSSALAFITHFLVYYPEIQIRIRNEIAEVIGKQNDIDYNGVQQLKYMEQVIMESLRMYPPISLMVNREAEEDVQYGPYKIPKEMTIQVPVYNINHDPDMWPNPEKFDPSRFSEENKSNINPVAFQSFGAGPRNCVGMRFAKLEIKLALTKLLKKFQLIRTEETDMNPITLKIGQGKICPAKGIIVKAIPIE